MNILKELKLPYPILLLMTLSLSLNACQCRSKSASFCGKIQLQTPFLTFNSSADASPLNRMITCRDQKLYFSTTLGLFPVSSIDYTTKTLTISHPSCSSSRYYVSPSLLSAGFPTPPQPNSLLLFSCSNQNHPPTASLHNCPSFNTCASSPYKTDQDHKLLGAPFSCLIISDLEKLGKSFHPKDLKCSHYLWLHRVLPSKDEGSKGYELGTRISFDIPDHLPNLCDECEKPNGNCGIGLRCICHPQACKDKIISLAAGSVKASE